MVHLHRYTIVSLIFVAICLLGVGAGAYTVTAHLRTPSLDIPELSRDFSPAHINPQAAVHYQSVHNLGLDYTEYPLVLVPQIHQNDGLPAFLQATIARRGGIAASHSQRFRSRHQHAGNNITAVLPPQLWAELQALAGYDNQSLQQWIDQQDHQQRWESTPDPADWTIVRIQIDLARYHMGPIHGPKIAYDLAGGLIITIFGIGLLISFPIFIAMAIDDIRAHQATRRPQAEQDAASPPNSQTASTATRSRDCE